METTKEYAISRKALERWAKERLKLVPSDEGDRAYRFSLSGSTCSNMGLPIKAEMVVEMNEEDRIVKTSTKPSPGDIGLGKMCAAKENGAGFIEGVGSLEEAHGMTIEEAAFHPWEIAPSGCFCSRENRLHKWRNVLQTIHYAISKTI